MSDHRILSMVDYLLSPCKCKCKWVHSLLGCRIKDLHNTGFYMCGGIHSFSKGELRGKGQVYKLMGGYLFCKIVVENLKPFCSIG
jgi:hypothetical protein